MDFLKKPTLYEFSKDEMKMFNPERLLGGLIGSGMRRKTGLGSLLSGGAALGLVGIAMEAVEHFMNKPMTGPSVSMPPPVPCAPQASPLATPPPPPGGVTPPGGAPPSVGGGAAPTDGGIEAPFGRQQVDAVLLIRAMIAAAYADGAIDERERSAILDKLQELALSSDEHQFIISELLAPKTRKSIVTAVTSPEIAQQVYLVSLLSIDVDTDAERRYLLELAQELALDRATVEKLHQHMGVSLPKPLDR